MLRDVIYWWCSAGGETRKVEYRDDVVEHGIMGEVYVTAWCMFSLRKQVENIASILTWDRQEGSGCHHAMSCL
jgi:hypothetical protein